MERVEGGDEKDDDEEESTERRRKSERGYRDSGDGRSGGERLSHCTLAQREKSE